MSLFKIFSEYWLWPIVVVIGMVIFKSELKRLSRRIIKGKIFGQEVEFSKEVDKFQEETQKVSVEVSDTPIDIKSQLIGEGGEPDQGLDEVLKAASIDPKLGIMALSALLERETRKLAISIGAISEEEARRLNFTRHVEILINKGYLPEHLSKALNIFTKLRNQIIHGHVPHYEDENILRVLDIGMSLLKVIRFIPLDVVESNDRIPFR